MKKRQKKKQRRMRRREMTNNNLMFSLLDSAVRVAEPLFLPTQQDILACKIRTTGVVELQFTLERVKFKYLLPHFSSCYSRIYFVYLSFSFSFFFFGYNINGIFRVLDLGGQRAERKKWHMFFQVCNRLPLPFLPLLFPLPS